MSLQVLSQIFDTTISSQNAQIMKQAEQQLNQFLSEPGFMQGLMLLSNTQTEKLNIRLAAVAHLKLIIQRNWNQDKSIVFCDQDKNQVKENLLQAIILSINESKIRNIYLAIVEKIASYDFPKNWLYISDEIATQIQSNSNPNQFYGSLLMLCQIVKCFKLYSGEDRAEVDPIIEVFLPILAQVTQRLITQGNDLESLRIIFKTLYSTVMLNLPDYFNQPQNLQFWMETAFKILNSPLTPNLTEISQNEEHDLEKQKNVGWKIKIKISQILQRFIQKVKKVDEKKQNGFQKSFLDNFSITFLEIFVKILKTQKDQFVPEKIVFSSLRYVFCAITIKKLYQSTQQYMFQFMTDICLPLIKITKSDIKLCLSDQEEYIRKQENYYYNSNMVAQDIIQSLCGKIDQDKTPFLCKFLKYLAEQMNKQDMIEKDMYMNSLGIIQTQVEKQIKKNKYITYKDIELLLQQFIIPELNSGQHFLRARACQIISKYSFIDFTDKNNVVNSVKFVCNCIMDKELHVRIHASMAINSLLCQDETIEMLRPELPNILKTYVQLMNQIDNEGVVLALEGIVQKFTKEVSPYAIDLISQLSLAFQTYAKKSDQQFQKNDEEDYDGQTEMTAASCLNTIKSILNGDLPQNSYPKIIHTLIPVFDYIFSNDGCDYMEEGADILNTILYYSDQIDQQLWFYFPTILYIVISVPQGLISQTKLNLSESQIKILMDAQEPWGQDYLQAIIPILKNFIQKGIDQIVKEKDYFGNSLLELIFALVDKFQNISKNGSSQENLSQVYSIFIALLENGLGKMDFILDRILTIILTNLPTLKKYEQMIKLEVLSVCFWYNTQLVFQFMNRLQCSEIVFKIWFDILPKLKFDYQKQRALFALSSILKLDQQELPQFIIQNLKHYLDQIIRLTSEVLEQREKDNDDDGFKDEESDEDDLEELDNALEIQGSKINLGRFENKELKNDEEEAIIENEFDSDDEYRDEITYDSPLDQICEILYFKDVIDQIQKKNNEFYLAIISQISSEQQQKLQENFKVAQIQDLECNYIISKVQKIQKGNKN